MSMKAVRTDYFGENLKEYDVLNYNEYPCRVDKFDSGIVFSLKYVDRDIIQRCFTEQGICYHGYYVTILKKEELWDLFCQVLDVIQMSLLRR